MACAGRIMADMPQRQRIARILLSTGFIVASTAYAFWQHLNRPDLVASATFTHAETPTRPMPSRAAALPPSITAAASPPKVAQEQETSAPAIAADAPGPAKAAPVAPAAPVAAAAQDSAPAATSYVPAAPFVIHYAEGEFTGDVADTDWGDVQVKVTIHNGAIASVDCPVYPNHRWRSIEINEWALPELNKEVITAQSADIDIVSQATYTSEGYRQTLYSALLKARQ